MHLNFVISCLCAAVIISAASSQKIVPPKDLPTDPQNDPPSDPQTDAPSDPQADTPNDSESDDDDDDTESSEKLVINVEHVESNTGYIQLKWNYTGAETVKNYELTAVRLDTEVIINIPTIEGEQYKLEDLRTETKYQICVVAVFENGNKVEECDEMSTVPTMMKQSMVALIILIILVVVICIVSYVLAERKRKEYEAAQMEEAEEEAEKDEKCNGDANATSSGAPPPSSIEEVHEIPYITPPVSELSLDDRDLYHRSLHL